MLGNAINQKDMDTLRDERLHELITIDYKSLTDQFQKNEEMGEKRVSLFTTLTAGLGAAMMIASKELDTGNSGLSTEVLIAVNVAWLLIGYLTFLRIVHRNVTTDKYKRQLRSLRTWFVNKNDSDALEVIPFNPYGEPDKVHTRLKFRGSKDGKGGYAELVGLINSMIVGALGWQITLFTAKYLNSNCIKIEYLHIKLISLIVVIGLAISAWAYQAHLARRIYLNSDL